LRLRIEVRGGGGPTIVSSKEQGVRSNRLRGKVEAKVKVEAEREGIEEHSGNCGWI